MGPKHVLEKQRGSASLEHVGLVMLVAVALAAGIAALAAAGPTKEHRSLGAMIARRIACAPRLPQPCRRDVLVEAYGRPLAHLIRALAPRLPHIRGRRWATALVEVRDRRRARGGVEIVYWLYRPGVGPGLGWSVLRRRVAAVPAPPPGRRPWPANSGNPRLAPLMGSRSLEAAARSLGLGHLDRLDSARLGLGGASLGDQAAPAGRAEDEDER